MGIVLRRSTAASLLPAILLVLAASMTDGRFLVPPA
jgi:hypothetical protein